MVVDDEGTLSITSTRIVFAGSRRSLDFPFGKLLGMNGFTDRVQFQIANRASQPLLRIPEIEHGGPLVMAYVNAAAGQLNG